MGVVGLAKHTMDLTTGSVTKKFLLFTLPILASNLLQQFYNAADTMVVGKFASETALAAVGSTGSLITLILSLFTGLSAGTNVACANHFGAKNQDKLRACMHVSLLLGLVCGIGLMAVGVAFARPLQVMMGSPYNVIDQATLYIRIYFLGVPASLLYNFASAILRAHGDTKRPMILLALSGIVNVLLNLLFVMVFHMDVEGVALATIISQYLSMAAALYLLFDPKGDCAMKKRELKMNGESVEEIVRIGVPTGINGIVFSLSNVICSLRSIPLAMSLWLQTLFPAVSAASFALLQQPSVTLVSVLPVSAVAQSSTNESTAYCSTALLAP